MLLRLPERLRPVVTLHMKNGIRRLVATSARIRSSRASSDVSMAIRG